MEDDAIETSVCITRGNFFKYALDTRAPKIFGGVAVIFYCPDSFIPKSIERIFAMVGLDIKRCEVT